MIETFSFSLLNTNSSIQQSQEYTFSSGLHVIYGESGVGKTELINLLTNTKKKVSSFYKINHPGEIKVVFQNPDLQIVSNTIENELAFNLECNSNNTKNIIQQLIELKSELIFPVNTNRHPVTLSGGEKEILNVTTTMSLQLKVMIIDDALSFLSEDSKKNIIDYLLSKNNTKCVILWFTSDEYDFKYSKSNYEITSTYLSRINSWHYEELPIVNLTQGKLNLIIDKLNFKYEQENAIFNDYSISISNFRCLGIVGDNGSGKSTLASILLGLEKPNLGTIKLTNQNNTDIKIGYLDQFPEKLLGIMTMLEFVELLKHHNKLDRAKLIEIEDSLKHNQIDWNNIKDTLAMDLSWTTLRFALIIILSNCDYDLLILDEPTFGMGSQQKLKLHSYFVRYLVKKHLILISHDNRFINSLCDSTIKL